MEECGLLRVQSGARGGVANDAQSEQAQRGLGGPDSPPPPTPPHPREDQTYWVSFPKHLLWIQFPVDGCLGGASNRTNLRVRFAHHHTRYTIVILEERNQPYPRCPQCDMLVSNKALNGRHLTTALC